MAAIVADPAQLPNWPMPFPLRVRGVCSDAKVQFGLVLDPLKPKPQTGLSFSPPLDPVSGRFSEAFTSEGFHFVPNLESTRKTRIQREQVFIEQVYTRFVLQGQG